MRERKGGGRDGRKDRAREQGSKREGHIHIYTHNHIQNKGIYLRRPSASYFASLCHMMMRAPRFSILAQCARSQDTTYGHTKFMQANSDMHIAHCAQEMIVKSVSSHVH